jgi:predicted enzyme related to lactoylglutathione lyase
MTDVRTDTINSPAKDGRRNPHGDFIWYELMTTDAEAAARFYSAVIPGWTLGERMSGDIDYRAIARSDGGNAGGVLQLDDSMRTKGARPAWLGYVGVDDVDSAVERIQSGGGSVLMPAWDIPGVGRIAMVADPQGVPLYVMRGAVDDSSDVFAPMATERVSWNELATRDQKAALDFYTSQFGWTPGDAMPMGDMGDYQLITHHGVPLGAIMTAAADKPARWRFYFRVADVDAAKDAVESGGGTVLHGPQEVPGGERILICLDPDGAEFAIVGK